MLIRRLVLIVSIVFTGSIALAVAATAAGGGLGPGSYTFTGTSASAYFGGFKGGPPHATFSVSVNRGLNSFEPEDGSTTVVQNTMVFFTQFDPTGAGGFGCFIIPPADFTVSSDLQSAALHTTLTSNNLCPGFGKPLGAATSGSGTPGLGGSLSLPITVDVTWSGVGVVSTFTDQFSYSCLARQTAGDSTFRDSVGGKATGTTSSLTGQFTTSVADVASQQGQLEVQGDVQPPCFG
jgi:hypothetical protein